MDEFRDLALPGGLAKRKARTGPFIGIGVNAEKALTNKRAAARPWRGALSARLGGRDCQNAVVMVDPNAHDRFVLRQRIRLVINQYQFALGDNAALLLCRAGAFKFKEDIRFYTDDSKSEELMRIKARHAFDPWATYDVTAADGSKLGELQKAFGQEPAALDLSDPYAHGHRGGVVS